MKSHVTIIMVVVFVLFISIACGSAEVVSEKLVASTPTPIPGWNKYEASGISMLFPESWKGGDLENDLDVVVTNLKSLGPDFDSVVEMIETNPSAFVLWIFDSNIAETGYLTNANLIQEKVLSAITLDAYINAFQDQLPISIVDCASIFL